MPKASVGTKTPSAPELATFRTGLARWAPPRGGGDIESPPPFTSHPGAFEATTGRALSASPAGFAFGLSLGASHRFPLGPAFARFLFR